MGLHIHPLRPSLDPLWRPPERKPILWIILRIHYVITAAMVTSDVKCMSHIV